MRLPWRWQGTDPCCSGPPSLVDAPPGACTGDAQGPAEPGSSCRPPAHQPVHPGFHSPCSVDRSQCNSCWQTHQSACRGKGIVGKAHNLARWMCWISGWPPTPSFAWVQASKDRCHHHTAALAHLTPATQLHPLAPTHMQDNPPTHCHIPDDPSKWEGWRGPIPKRQPGLPILLLPSPALELLYAWPGVPHEAMQGEVTGFWCPGSLRTRRLPPPSQGPG